MMVHMGRFPQDGKNQAAGQDFSLYETLAISYFVECTMVMMLSFRKSPRTMCKGLYSLCMCPESSLDKSLVAE